MNESGSKKPESALKGAMTRRRFVETTAVAGGALAVPFLGGKAPAYAQAASKLEPGVRLAKLDTDGAPDISARYGIRAIPTLIIFQHGKEVARQAGAMGAADIIRWINELLN